MTPKSVLLVEDSPIAKIAAQKLLEQHSCRVTVAPTGESAVDFYRRNTYDLVLLDIGLPDMDGVSAAGAMRKIKSINADTPIIALTAHDDAELRKHVFQAGMNDYCVKPLTATVLECILRKYFADAQDRMSISMTKGCR